MVDMDQVWLYRIDRLVVELECGCIYCRWVVGACCRLILESVDESNLPCVHFVVAVVVSVSLLMEFHTMRRRMNLAQNRL